MDDLKWIPKKYRERLESLERVGGLIGGCKYILYFNHNWCWDEEYWSIPVKSKKEALRFIKEARLRRKEKEAYK